MPGIDLDIDIMKGVVSQLGYEDSQIRVVMDEQATLSNLRSIFENWLSAGVRKDDKVLIYYSGHGAFVPDDSGDETDNVDEVLVLHDVKAVRRNGIETLDNVLVDDEFNEFLKQIPSNNITVMTDACHSGTVTKRIKLSSRSAFGQDEFVSKFLSYPGMPIASKGSFGTVESEPSQKAGKWVSMSAAQDDERSLASRAGSIFTLGVRESIRNAIANNRCISPKQTMAEVTEYVAKNTNERNRFHPHVSGNDSLINSPVCFAESTEKQNVVWRKLEGIVSKRDKDVHISINQQGYNLKDKLRILVQVPSDGYLNIINVGPNDVATVLFPNKFNQDNFVKAGGSGGVKIPTEQMQFELEALEPVGENLIVAILTKNKLNAYELGGGDRSSKGELLNVFASLSPIVMKTMNRSFGVVAGQANNGGSNWLGAGKIETVVCRSGCR